MNHPATTAHTRTPGEDDAPHRAAMHIADLDGRINHLMRELDLALSAAKHEAQNADEWRAKALSPLADAHTVALETQVASLMDEVEKMRTALELAIRQTVPR